MRRVSLVMVLFLVLCMTFASTVDASYSIIRDDADDYDDADYSGSIWGYSQCTADKETGEMTALGQAPWFGGTHTFIGNMYMYFEAEEDGQIYCSAKWTLTYRLEADTSGTAYAKLRIYYVLYSSSKTYIEKKQVYDDDAIYGGSGPTEIAEDIVNENHGTSKLFSTSLNDGSYYYVSVRIWLQVYNTYGRIYAYDEVGEPCQIDVNEIKVYR